jgi:hypothetical protein
VKRQQPEAELQRAVMDYLAYARPACIPVHIPNGGSRSKTEAAILKGMGVLPGAPDLVFLSASGSWCIELKAPGGKLSAAQVEFQARCSVLFVPYAVCQSLEEVHHWMCAWGLVDPKRISLPERRP